MFWRHVRNFYFCIAGQTIQQMLLSSGMFVEEDSLPQLTLKKGSQSSMPHSRVEKTNMVEINLDDRLEFIYFSLFLA